MGSVGFTEGLCPSRIVCGFHGGSVVIAEVCGVHRGSEVFTEGLRWSQRV